MTKPMREVCLGLAVLLYATTGFGTAWRYQRLEMRRAYDAYTGSLERSADKDDVWRQSYVVVIPLLPGLALVDSGYSVAPLAGYSSVKIVVWYVLGTFELVPLSWSVS